MTIIDVFSYLGNRNTRLCSTGGDLEKGDCQGDSGGPFFIKKSKDKYQQIGIVSYGAGCANPDEANVYARVAHYVDWIENQINTARPPSQGINGCVNNVLVFSWEPAL